MRDICGVDLVSMTELLTESSGRGHAKLPHADVNGPIRLIRNLPEYSIGS